MVRYIPRDFAIGVKRNERALKRISSSSRPDLVVRKTNSLVGGTLSKTLKQMLSLILTERIPLLSGLSRNFIQQIRKAVNSRRPIEQSGSGIFSVLKHVIPIVLPMVLSLFKKKTKK